MRGVAGLGPGERRVVPLHREVGRELGVGNVQGNVGNDVGIIEEEGNVAVFAEEFQGLLVDAVGRVVLPFEAVVAARIGGVGTGSEAFVTGHGGIIL